MFPASLARSRSPQLCGLVLEKPAYSLLVRSHFGGEEAIKPAALATLPARVALIRTDDLFSEATVIGGREYVEHPEPDGLAKAMAAVLGADQVEVGAGPMISGDRGGKGRVRAAATRARGMPGAACGITLVALLQTCSLGYKRIDPMNDETPDYLLRAALED
jgi:hypothetical protein